ncbi:4'-phosphopantetheine phosphatase isoform X3 [Diabrotica virgifera virgifera]|uniref:4'-phosphopantetheine phosphatase n=1 Tax=Diabrotica virgifera virgifera TaxID=50390 RepID=A0ABM5JIM5_DIAVI|nr:4'-phosphopantetheine phosphatase isoform X3 [Diabrotica virgifera virgifera]
MRFAANLSPTSRRQAPANALINFYAKVKKIILTMTGNEKYVCPLLKNPERYNPDTLNLVENLQARNYWLPCLEQMVKKFVSKAQYLHPDDPKATEKAEVCYQDFHNLLEQLTSDPNRWFEIIQGVLAGNVFDWGAKIVIDILESNKGNFGFDEATKTIQKRPWFSDKLDEFVDKLKVKPYKTCIIFVDNSGYDFVLGILPLAREFLSQGTKVVLTANSYPALNDVTFQELNIYCKKAADYCKIFERSLFNGKLVTVENGQKGPCLDLADLSAELCECMKSADLVIIEGMARAVHTNLYTKLTVDCLKLAVLKNEWLARNLGAEKFSVICDFDSAT